MPKYKIKRIKKHLFYDDQHILEKGIGKFDPDPDIASEWDRLIKGDFVKNDLDLLEHEYFESKLEKLLKLNYDIAQQITIDKNKKWTPPK